jgi:FKBP-type peptidyl-prolyl cis-trans isomerase FkpA/FKBP-type peptidyl-prolyl cis-trans isomerase FklB
MHRVSIAALAVILALPVAATQAATPKSEDEKTLYALGILLSRDLGPLGLNEQELEMVAAGMSDAALGREPQVDLATYGPQIQTFAQARVAASASVEKEAAAKFVADMAATDGARTTDSGLVFIDLESGEGASPTATDTVKVHYHGTLRDGTVFDSSVDRGEPISFPLNGVIPCWTEGLQLMKVGGKARLICPSDIAYGERGAGAKIKPGAALNFEVTLIGIEPAAAAE